MKFHSFEGIELDLTDEMCINQYLDEALDYGRFSSDRELARALEVGAATLNHWRKGRSLPKENAMLRLAALAAMDPEIASQHLALWRAENDQVKAAHLNTLGILYRLKELDELGGDIKKYFGAAAAAIFGLYILTNPITAQASPFVLEQIAHKVTWLQDMFYIMENFVIFCISIGFGFMRHVE